MADLPVEVTADILSRLPVKSLLHFRCVSKPWRALIDSPHFINLHLNRSIETNSNLSVIFRDGNLYSIDFDTLDRKQTMAVMLDHPLKPNEYGTGVVGSCNGLLCLSNMDMEQMVLWNFSTRKHHKLPVAPIIEFPCGLGFWRSIVYGFAYDSVRDDYKLVRIVQYYNGKNDGSVYSEVRVYTLKSNSWRRIQDFPYYLPYNTYKQLKQEIVVLVSGALHWVVCGGPNLGKANLIAAFDVGVEEFRLVPQPDYLDDKDFGMSVGSLGGCLCINCNYATDRVDVWVMKEYGVKESWTKLFSVEQPSVIFQFFDVRPLAYSKTGGEVLLDQDNAKLFWFDLRTKTVKNVKILCWPSFDEDLICVGSLVPLHSNGG